MGILAKQYAVVEKIKIFPVLVKKTAWNIQQYLNGAVRSFGILDWGLTIFFIISLFLLASLFYFHHEVKFWEKKRETYLHSVPFNFIDKKDTSYVFEDRNRLNLFEQLLISHEEIPYAIEDLLRLAENEGILVQRSDYRRVEDLHGQFMRYRIDMPLKGGSATINRFISKAMHGQRSLILESMQLKREKLDSTDLEANVKWVLLSRLPPVK
jgi:hypothetical protein